VGLIYLGRYGAGICSGLVPSAAKDCSDETAAVIWTKCATAWLQYTATYSDCYSWIYYPAKLSWIHNTVTAAIVWWHYATGLFFAAGMLIIG
jgi:hypothetical protein